MIDYLLGWRWLRSLTIAEPTEPPPQNAANGALPLAEQILQLCQSPATLGELADATGLTYRELIPALRKAIADGKIKTLLLPVGGLHAMHYQTTQPIPTYGTQR